MSVYGFPGSESGGDATKNNGHLLKLVLRAGAELGNVPIVILGDFNITPEKSLTLCAAFSTGCWLDAALQMSALTGSRPQPTCFASPQGTRIDAVLCSAVAAVGLRDLHLVDDTGLPTHVPIQVCLDMPSYSQEVRKQRTSAPFPATETKWTAKRENETFQRAYSGMAERWTHAYRSSDIEGLWALWCDLAENYLAARCDLSATSCPGKYRGRGRVAEPRPQRVSACQRPDQTGAVLHHHRVLLKLTRRVEEHQRHIAHLQGLGAPGVTPQETSHLWQNIVRTGPRVAVHLELSPF
ncbi:unnamed protein product [Polarella glacialis]|uniref:Endonuclease/exonuclease/phosphatase domain-containing protein n=1 Tax=Polarella glacialis TaxID=89957 RepID=A0A813J2L8_POLGL|nr:unnamed protein product [Polarella glacialis]